MVEASESSGLDRGTLRERETLPRPISRTIRPWGIVAVAGSAYGVLLVLGLIGAFLTHAVDDATVQKAAEIVLFEEESNLPTLFNFLLLVANMAAFAVVSAFAFGGWDKWRWHWLALTALFLLLAYDEAAQLHEKLSVLLESRVGGGTGFLGFAWVVPGMAAVAVVGMALIPFLRALPRRSAVLFLLAGAIFVSGSIGVEMVEAEYAGRQGWDTLTFSLLTVVEESLEMIGLITLLYGTTSHLVGPHATARFALDRVTP